MPSSGPISISNLNTIIGNQATATLDLDSSTPRNLASLQNGAQTTSGTPISLSQLYGKTVASIQFNSTTTNLDLFDLFIAAQKYSPGKTYGVVNIGSSAVIGSTTSGAYALNVTGFTAGDKINIQNAGYIVGKGADYGGAAGPAMLVQSAGAQISLYNTGTIGGGGGYGYLGSSGGSLQNKPRYTGSGGGGGGGAGYYAGAGGGSSGGQYAGGPGGPGTLTTGGPGGGAGPWAYPGGPGGNLGQPGSSGSPAGLAVNGWSGLQVAQAGTILGTKTG
jgi:hypothetical protein